MKKTCKHCKKEVMTPHYCNVAKKNITEKDDDDFLLSVAIGAATDNALLGGMLGGNLTGGLVGDMLNSGDELDNDSSSDDSDDDSDDD